MAPAPVHGDRSGVGAGSGWRKRCAGLVPGGNRSSPVPELFLLIVAGVVAGSSVVRGLAPRLMPFSDPGFQGRVGLVLVRSGFAGLAMVGVGLALLTRSLRHRIERLAGPLATVLAVASLVTSGVGIAAHYDEARPWGRLEEALDEVHLPGTWRLVDEDHVDRLYDGAPGVRRIWAVPPAQGRDDTCAQLRDALAPLRGHTPPEVNPGRCDFFVPRSNHDMSAWLDDDGRPDRPTPAQLQEMTGFVIIEVIAR